MNVILKNLPENGKYFLFTIFFFAALSFLTRSAVAQPPVLDGGMTPVKLSWTASSPQDHNANTRIKFWLKVQRHGYLNRFGTFDYRFNTKVVRPDGSVVWNTSYGFDENGYGEIEFVLPALFYERSNSRTEPDPGTWTIRIAATENNSNRDVGGREFRLQFTKGASLPPSSAGYSGDTDPNPQGEVKPPAGKDVVYLSDLNETRNGNLHGGLGKDRPYWQNDLIIAGKKYAKGLVTHPPADNDKKTFVEYDMAGGYSRFLATLGSAEDHGNYGRGTMNYCVFVDGRMAECGPFPVPPTTKEISINVGGAKLLRLEVDNGYDGNHSDHAAWGDARLIR